MNLPPPTERRARVIWLAVTGLGVALVWGVGQVMRDA